jgi:hypothetical protein
MSSQDSNPAKGLLAGILKRTIAADIVQGAIAGCVLAFIAATLLINAETRAVYTTVNGWSTTLQAGKPGNSFLLRAAIAKILPAANLPEEAAYWTTAVDSTGQQLNGQHDYVLHFPSGGLPPNDAFWSLTMADAKGVLAANSINRYSLGDRSGLGSNADGSMDIYIQNTAPAGHAANWLPAPTGDFMLWLRAYQPGQSVLDGSYQVPPVVEVK